MRVINDVSNQRFSLDGIEYLKNFLSRIYGNKITIYNAYDKNDILVENELYTNVELNGVVYGSASLLQQAILTVIYTRNSLSGIVQDSPYFNYFNNIEGFSLVGQDLTIYADWAWTIQGGSHTNASDVILNVPYATTGYHRIDIVVANTLDAFELIQGIEVLLANSPAEPSTPIGTLKVTSLSVTEGTISDPATPTAGTDFVKKQYSLSYSYSTGTTNAVYSFRPEGKSVYNLTGSSLVSVSGFNLDLIDIDAEQLYDGKIIRLINSTGNEITLNDNDDTNAEVPFLMKNGANLAFPANETIEFYFSGNLLNETFRSWEEITTSETILQNLGGASKFTLPTTNNYPFLGGAVNSGAITAGYNFSPFITNEYAPNYLLYTTYAAGSNRGYKYSATGQLNGLWAGLTFFCIVMPCTITDITSRFGMLHTTTYTANVETLTAGAWFNLVNNTLTAKTASAGSATTGSSVVINNREWLMLFIEVVSNPLLSGAQSISFKAKKIDGTVIYNETITGTIVRPINTTYAQMEIGIISTKGTAASNEALIGVSHAEFWSQKPNHLTNF